MFVGRVAFLVAGGEGRYLRWVIGFLLAGLHNRVICLDKGYLLEININRLMYMLYSQKDSSIIQHFLNIN